jgi:diguanylate cyclase (GGDEF)-like protein
VGRRLSGLQGLSGIVGAAYAVDGGSVRRLFGDLPFEGDARSMTGRGSPGPLSGRSAASGTHHDIAWVDVSGGRSVTYLIRLDVSDINAKLAAFILRIAGLVAIIVLFVTAGTMFVVDRLVLLPVVRLRESMLSAGADPDNAERYRIERPARDELADVQSAHNAMLFNMAESKRVDRAVADERARFLSRHDSLTGLPNREYYLEHLQRALDNRPTEASAVHGHVMNLSGFRAINDAFGQHAGDQALKAVAEAVRDAVGVHRFVARLGGDEFGIVDEVSREPAQAATFAQQILDVVEKPLVLAGKPLRLRGRIGIACAMSGDVTAAQLLHDAQVALNLARAEVEPKTHYRFFAAGMMELVLRRQETERELAEALTNGQLRLFYQPKVTVAQGEIGPGILSCEALIRWMHPQRGMVSPGDFIPIAEASGLIFDIGEWALREACAQIRRWRDAGYVAPRVAVNIASRQFQDVTLPDVVCQIIKAEGIEPGALELEITETAAMSDVRLSVTVINALRRIGVRLSIDDFGTGYSSLSYLRQFDVDSIKIDKSFIDDIAVDRNAAAVCDAIIRLGHSLGKKIIAEGVENPAQLDFLRRRNCEEAQGYLFARPMPAEELVGKLARSGTDQGADFNPVRE